MDNPTDWGLSHILLVEGKKHYKITQNQFLRTPP